LSEELPSQGFAALRMYAEDWGWRIDFENGDFPLWLGCGNYQQYKYGFLCFIEPSRPFVRRLLKKIPTTDTVERLAGAMQMIFERQGGADALVDRRRDASLPMAREMAPVAPVRKWP
jgi:hypothetical protein